MPAIPECTLFPLSKVKEHLFVFLGGSPDRSGGGRAWVKLWPCWSLPAVKPTKHVWPGRRHLKRHQLGNEDILHAGHFIFSYVSMHTRICLRAGCHSFNRGRFGVYFKLQTRYVQHLCFFCGWRAMSPCWDRQHQLYLILHPGICEAILTRS